MSNIVNKTKSNITGKKIIFKQILVVDKYNNLHLENVPHIDNKPLVKFSNCVKN